ncbi:hypothetical protein BIW53_17105 [Pseudoalteromonas byunsanensis]|uniref:Uncharacterized protein n=1 Tax=Pseudoalteromonas byunsanensis TaxID=327939 RepID=A0A1S1N3A8_9GAMM|nr:hypothetical protein BIW53_17105 [Pseudoalteromonas byunsanensis]
MRLAVRRNNSSNDNREASCGELDINSYLKAREKARTKTEKKLANLKASGPTVKMGWTDPIGLIR